MIPGVIAFSMLVNGIGFDARLQNSVCICEPRLDPEWKDICFKDYVEMWYTGMEKIPVIVVLDKKTRIPKKATVDIKCIKYSKEVLEKYFQ